MFISRRPESIKRRDFQTEREFITIAVVAPGTFVVVVKLPALLANSGYVHCPIQLTEQFALQPQPQPSQPHPRHQQHIPSSVWPKSRCHGVSGPTRRPKRTTAQVAFLPRALPSRPRHTPHHPPSHHHHHHHRRPSPRNPAPSRGTTPSTPPTGRTTPSRATGYQQPSRWSPPSVCTSSTALTCAGCRGRATYHRGTSGSGVYSAR